MTLRLIKAEPRQGAAWVRRAFMLFGKQPLAFASLFALFLFVALSVLALPYIGALLLMLTLPLLSLGFMIATRAAMAGAPVHPGRLIEPLRSDGGVDARRRRRTLLTLCGWFALGSALVMLASDALDGGAFERLQVLLAGKHTEATNKQIEALLATPGLSQGLALRLGGTALLSIPFWHAPALIWWHNQGVAKSLFSSTLACWRNRVAFLYYGLVWVLCIVAFSVLVGSMLALLGVPGLISLAAAPAGLMFSTVFYISLYFTYADSFAEDAAVADGVDAAAGPA